MSEKIIDKETGGKDIVEELKESGDALDNAFNEQVSLMENQKTRALV